MKNFAIAKIFRQIADAYEVKGVQWKPRAYRRAARRIENLNKDITDLYEQGDLGDLKGLGQSLQDKVEEYLETGKIEKREQLLRQIPAGVLEVMDISGVGAAKARQLHRKLGISGIDELEAAAQEHRLKGLEGFGQKSEEEILRGIEELKGFGGRYRLDLALKSAEEVMERLRAEKVFSSLALAGSLRRQRATIGDVDILAVSAAPEKAVAAFVALPGVADVIREGDQRSSVRLESGIQVDLRLIDKKAWGAALQYFTGSKAHNIALREMAVSQGFKLNEYGLFKEGQAVAGEEEQAIYENLGLKYIEPELREDKGEIEAARKDRLPVLVQAEDIKGDLHAHSDWSDGELSMEEMVKAAQKRGYEYICISDHSRSRAIAHGLDAGRLREQIKKARLLDEKVKNIKVLTGSEVDIRADGSLDMPAELLAELDVVIASVHSGFKAPVDKMTGRVIKAIRHPRVNILGHPTGRIINSRSGYELDLPEIYKAAARNKVALEVNAAPERLDMDGDKCRAATKAGARIVINTDAHSASALDNMRFGLAQARRGWAEAGKVVNTYDWPKLKEWFSPK